MFFMKQKIPTESKKLDNSDFEILNSIKSRGIANMSNNF